MSKFSIYAWFGFFPITSEERFQLIKAAGFDGVLLWWDDESFRETETQTSQLKLARREGLFVENIHTPFLDVNNLWLANATGDRFENTLKQCIIDCGRHEIPTAVIHVTQSATPPSPNQIGLDRLKRLVELAESKKVNLALENLRRPEYLDYIFAKLQSDRLGFCYDAGHEHCYCRATDLLAKYGSKLMALHLHDNDGQTDQHQIPGEGTVDWPVLKVKLRQTGYSGPMALEVIRQTIANDDTGETAGQYLQRAFQAASRLLAGVE
jgi:L-ribulose-5-phosphate 3-epimerase